MTRVRYVAALLLVTAPVLAGDTAPRAKVLEGTQPLTIEGDLAAQMVQGIDKYLMRELAASVARRAERWKPDFSSADAYAKSVAPQRARLQRIIGAVDPRKPAIVPEFIENRTKSDVAGHRFRVRRVRWPVCDGLDAEGLLLEPTAPAGPIVIALPDADGSPEQLAGLEPGIPAESQFARQLAQSGCTVLIPIVIDRRDTWSGSPSVRYTNQPHREFIYRAAFEMGRHVIGYEVQKVLAAVDWLKTGAAGTKGARAPALCVMGYGEGGLVALYAGALDPRIDATAVSGYFQEREGVWQEPIYRNVWSLLRDFGDAEIAGLIAPRRLVIEACQGPTLDGPPPPHDGRNGAAPGRLVAPPFDSVRREFARARGPFERLNAADHIQLVVSGDGAGPPASEKMLRAVLTALGAASSLDASSDDHPTASLGYDSSARLRAQFDGLNEFTQRIVRQSESVREQFWSKADTSSVEKFVETSKPYRDYLGDQVIGRLPVPTDAPNVRTRLVHDEPKWTGYEVMLDVYPDVFAYGVLLLPKDLKPGERRPVVVCQHGLEGRPRDTIQTDVDGFKYYKAFSARLAERGFVVYAPQNPYIGQDKFRVLQRKANPLGLSLFSFIIRQHERTLDWLATQPFVDPSRIAFYGLSYGGKTAVRVPPVLADRYCLSICSADYNEWIVKNTSISARYSYMFTGEYEMVEFDLGNTFNYAELASLMVPRPFMVERGHRDGVAPDEWVAYEYSKVRRLYDQLGLGDRTTIEFFNGPHEIHGVGTFEFLEKHLDWHPATQ